MEIVELKGLTRHGKNRVNQHGARWVVVKKSGEDLWVESIDCSCSTCEKWGQDGRWITEKKDRNFEIVGRELHA